MNSESLRRRRHLWLRVSPFLGSDTCLDGHGNPAMSYTPRFLAVALLMLCFTFLGDGLRDALDPRWH